MARNVIWAYAAEEDLEAAASYIHRDSPVYAASFVDRVLEAGRVPWMNSQSAAVWRQN
jgi:plasmid stabilization system protein ParE